MPSSSIHDPSRTRLITVAEVRNRVGFDSSDVSDGAVEDAIEDAQAHFINDTGRWVQGLELDGDIDGSNTDFEVPAPWRLIADDTLNETIDASDVHVYSEDTDTDPPTRSTLTVSSVDSRFGVITLNSAPSSGVDVKFDGYVIKRAWDIELVKSAIKALASWYVYGKAREGNEVLTADPGREDDGTNTQPAGKRHLDDYSRAIQALSGGSSFAVASKDKRHGSGSSVFGTGTGGGF